ncbi:hypothetical protein I547_7482 [Mycobacterium kansasii 824]|nr:hypothetical protein I547_7482 [Mycobacterium kansasii 824]
MIYLAARNLAPSGFSVFGVFWGAFGLVAGAAFGLLQETTREVRSMQYLDVLPDGSRIHPLRAAALVGVAAAVVIAGSAPLWSGRCSSRRGGCRWDCSASAWPDSACTPR